MAQGIEEKLEAIEINEEVRSRVIVTMKGNDFSGNLDTFGLTMESTDQEIIDAVAPAVLEQFGTDIKNTFKVNKALNSQNIYVIPNAVAGK